MQYYSGEFECLVTAAKRIMVILVVFAAVFILICLSTGERHESFASDKDTASIITLTVEKDGEVVKEFTQNDLEQIANLEGNKTYTYSAWNTFPTFDKSSYANVTGPTVDSVLREAGVRDYVTDTGTVSFSDGVYKASFTGSQLFEEKRYYFPYGSLAKPTEGMAPEESYSDATEVQPVIYLSGGNDGNVLCIGQAAPNDENKPAFVKSDHKTLDGKSEPLKYENGAIVPEPMIIEVSTSAASQCALPEAIPPNKSRCKGGQEVTFSGKRRNLEYIYYTIDGSEPDYGSAIYNSGMNQGIETGPVLPDKSGVYQIKVKVKAYGKQDSDVASFTYTVLSEPSRPVVKLTAGKKKITVRWKKITGANGYMVYRSTKKSSGYKLIKTIKKGSTVSFTNKKLKKGKRYYYKVRAYKNAYGTKVFSKYSSVKSTKAK